MRLYMSEWNEAKYPRLCNTVLREDKNNIKRDLTFCALRRVNIWRLIGTANARFAQHRLNRVGRKLSYWIFAWNLIYCQLEKIKICYATNALWNYFEFYNFVFILFQVFIWRNLIRILFVSKCYRKYLSLKRHKQLVTKDRTYFLSGIILNAKWSLTIKYRGISCLAWKGLNFLRLIIFQKLNQMWNF